MPSRCQLCSALELRSKDMLATELISRRKTRARVRVSQVVPVRRKSSPDFRVASDGCRHCFTCERMLFRAGGERLMLPVWELQGHWCLYSHGCWQPGPCQPKGHS